MHQLETIESSLLTAQSKAYELFNEVEKRGLICAGKTERQLSDETFALADELFGIKKHWHKRIVRTGKNTVHPYAINPPDLTIQDNDILFFDFGPVFEDFEADFGKSYVLGSNSDKLKLRDSLVPVFDEIKALYQANRSQTGAKLYLSMVMTCEKHGYKFGNVHCGHLIGQFPHEKILGDNQHNYICADNHTPMDTPDKNGNPRHWILEIHLLQPNPKADEEYGGFYEDLLSL